MPNATPTVDETTKPPRRFHRLRLAVSVFFGVLTTVALVVQWARSYAWQDYICMWVSPARTIRIISGHGWVDLRYDHFDPKISRPDLLPQGELSTHLMTGPDNSPQAGWKWQRHRDWLSFWVHAVVPHWLLFAFLITVMSIAFWFQSPASFSLRTLLIATTLVAVVLGLAVWAGRKCCRRETLAY
jgi:hypothetical protein